MTEAEEQLYIEFQKSLGHVPLIRNDYDYTGFCLDYLEEKGAESIYIGIDDNEYYVVAYPKVKGDFEPSGSGKTRLEALLRAVKDVS